MMEKRSATRQPRAPTHVLLRAVGTTTGTSWHFANLPAVLDAHLSTSPPSTLREISPRTAAVTFTLQCPPVDLRGRERHLRRPARDRERAVDEQRLHRHRQSPARIDASRARLPAPCGTRTSASSGYFTWTASRRPGRRADFRAARPRASRAAPNFTHSRAGLSRRHRSHPAGRARQSRRRSGKLGWLPPVTIHRQIAREERSELP